MPRVTAQVILRTADLIPANYVTNTYHFSITTDDPINSLDDITDEVATALTDLYDDIRSRLGGMAQTGHRIKFTDIDEPRPSFPYKEVVFDFTGATASGALPSEVAICSSFEGDPIAGTNQASRRGRVYLGKIAQSALASDNTGTVTGAALLVIQQAFEQFAGKQDQAGFSGWIWTVYSPTLDLMAPVTSGHVDNAFDTQRRRGIEATSRLVWTYSPGG
uniref:Uncharacterized protein n=1 Tax=uncultured prokaryote TaxID=198431 RepID=A0A0H5Q734_9ZZZZ|nr:hypothetical protein [uncultured prokaryote]